MPLSSALFQLPCALQAPFLSQMVLWGCVCLWGRWEGNNPFYSGNFTPFSTSLAFCTPHHPLSLPAWSYASVCVIPCLCVRVGQVEGDNQFYSGDFTPFVASAGADGASAGPLGRGG